jgi:hypothetical protein
MKYNITNVIQNFNQNYYILSHGNVAYAARAPFSLWRGSPAIHSLLSLHSICSASAVGLTEIEETSGQAGMGTAF